MHKEQIRWAGFVGSWSHLLLRCFVPASMDDILIQMPMQHTADCNIARAYVCAQEAWDWVASLEQVDAVRFHLASSFPRKIFTDEEQRSTLVELGLAPQAALFVQVADE